MLSLAIDKIDKESELIGLTAAKYRERKELDDRLHIIRKEEHVKWFQRLKEVDLVQGDSLTPYFMAKASGRKRKTKITSLDQEGVLITGDENILNFATSFYKELFGPVKNCASVELDIPLGNVLSSEDREMLVREFSVKELK